ncbi:hypothetical protein PMAYCL1PPCAC_00436, partial [Pristionchus mayeri]
QILIDDAFINAFSDLSSTSPFGIHCTKTVLRNVDEENTRKFLSWAISAKHDSVRLTKAECRWDEKRYAWFILKIPESLCSLVVDNGLPVCFLFDIISLCKSVIELIVLTFINIQAHIPFPSGLSINILSQFRYLRLFDLLFDTDDVMKLIKAQIIAKRAFNWVMSITEPIDAPHRLRAFRDSLKVIYHQGGLAGIELRENGSLYEVTIELQDFPGRQQIFAQSNIRTE